MTACSCCAPAAAAASRSPPAGSVCCPAGSGVARAATDLRAGGEREFLFVAPGGAPLLSWIDGLDCRLAKRHRGRYLRYFDLDIQRCAFAAR